MYPIENPRELLRSTAGAPSGFRAWLAAHPTVFFLGLTSLFTDVSSEMVSTVLPLYLVQALGLSLFEVGIVDGLYHGGGAALRALSGFVADRKRGHRELAALGYGLSALCKLGLLVAAGSSVALSLVVFLDRTGKGIRTAPRDALISLSARDHDLGRAFGIHRALDTCGAMLGPLVGVGILLLAPRAYDAVFVVGFLFAIIGLAILLLFVRNPDAPSGEVSAPAPSLTDALRLFRVVRFRRLVYVASALQLATVSDGLLYLGLERRMGFQAGFFPLLYVGTAFVYMMLAVPLGKLSDRVGRHWVFIFGYAMLLLAYTALLRESLGVPHVLVCLVAFGAYYAATDGVLMALAGPLLPVSLRATGLALLTTATSLARMVASVLFGALWHGYRLEVAVMTFVVFLAATLLLGAIALARANAGLLSAQRGPKK